MNTLELAKLKQHLLQEIEELDELNMPKPEDAYPFKTETKKVLKNNDGIAYGDYYLYTFENRNGDLMEVTCMVEFPEEGEDGLSLFIAFGYEMEVVEPEDEKKKYAKQTGANDMLKVMATVIEAIKRTFKKVGGVDKVKDIRFSPSDERRSNIYDRYIETFFSKKDPEDIEDLDIKDLDIPKTDDEDDYDFEKNIRYSSEKFKIYKNKKYGSSKVKPK